jgi:hypothetical protein
MLTTEYDERQVLEDYVWKHYGNLFTAIEKRGVLLANGGIYPAGSHNAMNADRFTGPVDVKELKAALADGVEALRSRAATRVIGEHADEIFIHRCPECDRVVRTPVAKQCFWCGHDWHNAAFSGSDSLAQSTFCFPFVLQRSIRFP